MRNHPYSPIAGLLAASLLAGAPLAARAQDSMIIEAVTATPYVNGGIGQDEVAAMRRIAGQFPLRMTFSERKDGAFLADVPVIITDTRGSPVFELNRAGPMLYVDLPGGKYKVSAQYNGLVESRDVTLAGSQGKDLNFHWKGEPGA